MTSATSRPTTMERGVNSRMCGGFCGPGDGGNGMRRIVCGHVTICGLRRIRPRSKSSQSAALVQEATMKFLAVMVLAGTAMVSPALAQDADPFGRPRGDH